MREHATPEALAGWDRVPMVRFRGADKFGCGVVLLDAGMEMKAVAHVKRHRGTKWQRVSQSRGGDSL